MEIAVIGGTRGLGNWIASYLKKKGCDVTITGRDNQQGINISRKMGVKYTPNNIEAANNSDITILAVPIDVIPRTIEEIAPHLKAGSLLVDVASVKEKPAQIMLEYVPDGAEFLPIHPVFGPRIRSLDGQVVVLTPIKKGKWYEKVIKFLESENARLIETTPTIHDQMMSVVQGLTHFTYISMAATLEKLDVDVKASRKFSSPIYNLMLDMITRITAQNPYLYYSIQTHNPYIPQTREEFLSTYKDLNEMVGKGKKNNFVKIMSSAAKHMNDLEASLGRSDKAISVLNHELNILKNSIGKEVGLRHVYSRRIHVGKLEEISPEFVTLTHHSRSIKLKISNVEILSPGELQTYKYDTIPRKSFDVSVVLPESANAEMVTDVVQSIDDVVDSQLMDVYHGGQINKGMISITLRYEVINPHAREKVEALLKGFGGIIR